MRVLVTGGAGFIGSHLTEALMKRGDDVIVMDNLTSGRRANLAFAAGHPRLTLVAQDVCQSEHLRAAAVGADLIVHLAAHVGVRRILGQTLESLRNNVLGTMAVLEEAARCGTRTVYFSSSEVYGQGGSEALTEEQDLGIGPPNIPRWSYAAGKAIDEALALAYHAERGLPVTVVRCFNTCGPRQTDRYGMVVPTFIAQALAGEPLTVHGDGTQRRCFSFVGDVVRGVMLLAAAPATVGEVFNVGNDEEVTIQALAERVIGLTGGGAGIEFVPYDRIFEEPFEDVRRRVPSLEKIRTFVGYEPEVMLDQLLRLTIRSHCAERREPPRSTPAPRCAPVGQWKDP